MAFVPSVQSERRPEIGLAKPVTEPAEEEHLDPEDQPPHQRDLGLKGFPLRRRLRLVQRPQPLFDQAHRDRIIYRTECYPSDRAKKSADRQHQFGSGLADNVIAVIRRPPCRASSRPSRTLRNRSTTSGAALRPA